MKLAAFAFCFVLQGFAQPSHPHPPPPPSLGTLFGGHAHARPVPANVEKTPEVTLDATSLGSPLVLEKGWRVGITANPAASAPDFDDSTWAVREAQQAFADVPDEDHPAGDDQPGPDHNSGPDQNSSPPRGHQRPFAWFRLHVKLAPNHGPLALLIELPVSQITPLPSNSAAGPGADVFANGKEILAEGPNGDAPQNYQQISRLYSIDIPADETNLVLVVRTPYFPFGNSAYTSFFSARTLHLGHRQELERRLELWNTHGLFERLPRVVNSILLTVLALFLLVLYFTQKGHVEYLWLALHELVQAPIGFVELAGSSARIDRLWYAAIVLELVLISAYLYFEFLIAFLSLRRRWFILLLRYTSPVILGVGPILLFVGHGRHSVSQAVIGITLVVIWALSLIWLLGWLSFVSLTLIYATIRRNFEAGLLLIPLVLSIIGIAEPIVTGGMSEWSGHDYHSPLTLMAGPVPIHFASIADFTGILAIVVIIFIRFLRVQRDQERASSELAAARSVQELMIPQEKIQTPGFEVDSIYNPANEVGGDFFHVQPTEEGGLLVIIGDVAGKGLKAAMNVSMLMGALRRTPERSPARILESLNRVLTGSESFTTCQVALFSANGEVVLANAGHLPPYLNSQEITLPGGLPLGVLDDNTYEEVRLYLHPGDRILLMSDGVVEARQPSGELFGFERVHNLTGQSAFYIADAAKAFGQEDDITILTIRRLAQAMAA
jgi:hypothetical protein